MEIIHNIEAAKYTILDHVYTLFPDGYFHPSTSIPRTSYRLTCAKFREIEDNINAANQQWWDKFFLDLYLTYKITPRGLRNLKVCSFFSADLSKEWSAISEFCMQKWIELIIKQHDTLYNSLLSKITDLIKALKSIRSPFPPPLVVQEDQMEYKIL